jgi:hypothetical protein
MAMAYHAGCPLGSCKLSDLEHGASQLHKQYLNSDGKENNSNEKPVAEEALENIRLVVHFTRVDFIENLDRTSQKRHKKQDQRVVNKIVVKQAQNQEESSERIDGPA